MTRVIGIASVLCLLGIAGCGDSAEPVDRTETGAIEDGDSTYNDRTCDSYDITVGEGWNVDVRMTSEYDNIVFMTMGDEEVAMNDDGDQGLNAHMTHTTTASGSATIQACAYSDGRGNYTLAIQANPAN